MSASLTSLGARLPAVETSFQSLAISGGVLRRQCPLMGQIRTSQPIVDWVRFTPISGHYNVAGAFGPRISVDSLTFYQAGVEAHAAARSAAWVLTLAAATIVTT